MDRIKSFNIMRTAVALLISFITAFVIIALVSDTPFESIRIFAISPFTSPRYIGNILENAIPLIFSGLAMSVLFQSSLFNLGGEGVFYISGALISLLAIFVPMPSGIHPFVAILFGTAAGMAVMLLPGYLKARYNGSELVTSLMLNNILLGVGLYLLARKLRDPTAGAQISYKFQQTALLPVIIPGTRIHAGLLIALACVAVIYLFLYKTKWGYALRMTGVNKDFAGYSGISTFAAIILAHLIAGALFGMGGAVETLGMHKRFEWSGLPGYGFDGCMIAMLSNNNPLGVIPAALFVGYLRIGADMVARLSDVPTEMISVLQCIILLLISAERFLHHYRQKWIERS
ncbi:MAG: ABC transporter permease [Hungatella sp.]|nr:ABC transporter permease [Hungatella sp.]